MKTSKILKFKYDSEPQRTKLQISQEGYSHAVPRRDLSTKKTKPNIEK